MGTDPRKMAAEQPERSAPRDGERGFSLLDLIVAVAIFSSFVLATASVFGARAPSRHLAAAALQAALVEARSLALANADATDLARPTGATVTVAPDPLDAAGSVITVYRSRPIPNAASGGSTFPLVPDVGFPVQHVHAKFAIDASTPLGAPFAVLLSSSGYASIVAPYEYSPSQVTLIASDPGCSDAGVTIAVSAGAAPERHPFVCRDGSFDLSIFQ